MKLNTHLYSDIHHFYVENSHKNFENSKRVKNRPYNILHE